MRKPWNPPKRKNFVVESYCVGVEIGTANRSSIEQTKSDAYWDLIEESITNAAETTFFKTASSAILEE